MIRQIDDLIIPETISGNAELFNADKLQRTVSMRLVRKSSMAEKWRVTLNYEGRAIFPELRLALYNKCRTMRGTAGSVTFVSPYDGITYTVQMLCTQPFPPKMLSIYEGSPFFYSNCGAAFEEV